MKKWLIIAGLLAALLVSGFFAIFKVVIPRSVKVFAPVKWQNIPLGQKKIIVHEYLGKPGITSDAQDHWEEKINTAKKYELRIKYNTDTIAESYSIIYKVEVAGFSDVTPVAADSIY